MTKFILVGGYVKKAPDGGAAFCDELVRGFEDPVKILVCMFARRREVWEEAFAGDIDFFRSRLPNKILDIQLAENGRLSEQVQWADVVFFRGGSSHELVDALKAEGDWMLHTEDKTIAGTSAGADALSKYYFGLDTKEVREGMGLLPVKVIPHFRSDYHGWEFDWDAALKELAGYREDLLVFALGEGEFRVVEK